MDGKHLLGIAGAAVAVAAGAVAGINELRKRSKKKKLEGKINEKDNGISVETDDVESVKEEDNSEKALSPFEDENDAEISMSKLDGFGKNNKNS